MRINLCFLLLLFLPTPAPAAEGVKVIHVLVALCDNDYQGIVKVPKHL
jgi:hypothetical protein